MEEHCVVCGISSTYEKLHLAYSGGNAVGICTECFQREVVDPLYPPKYSRRELLDLFTNRLDILDLED